MKVAFIGGGVMAEAIVRGLLVSGQAKAEDMVVSDVSPERRKHLEATYHVSTTSDNKKSLRYGEVVVLAVKPDVLTQVMAELKGKFKPQQLALSIVAGATMRSLTSGLGHDVVVRAMPNTPAQIGQAMTVWTATPQVGQTQRDTAATILGALGRQLYVADEKYIDMATAVSGSGPAYVFLFTEALVDAAVHIGMPRIMAEQLVGQTLLGSAQMVQQTGRHPAELRNAVTSPGGTTAEALLRLEAGGLRAVITEAVAAAYEKSKQLGKGGG